MKIASAGSTAKEVEKETTLRETPSESRFPGSLGHGRYRNPFMWGRGRGGGEEEDLQHPAHQRPPLEFHWVGTGVGLHPAQRCATTRRWVDTLV